MSSPLVLLPAQSIGNYLLVEVKWDRFGPYRFLVDTGSSVTLVTPTLARRYAGRNLPFARNHARASHRTRRHDHGIASRIDAADRSSGDARFENVDVLIYDANR
jgi:hypothetical protein